MRSPKIGTATTAVSTGLTAPPTEARPLPSALTENA